MLHGPALLERLLAVPFLARDAWIDQLLGFPEPPADRDDLPRGAVPYLPCGVEEVIAMVREVPVTAEDVVVDIGAGLGRVAILVHLLSGARTSGIELQEHLVRAAEARCAALELGGVSFVHGDAAEVALDGTIYFLFAPCNGELLAQVLARLEAASRDRRIRVCCVGVELDDVAWLRRRPTRCRTLSLYER